jgi:hypothetical protein
MTQASPTIGANKSGLTYRQEDNDGKKALLNHHKGSTAPTYAEAGTLWLDDTATPWVLKLHDGTDWLKLYDLNASNNAVTPYLGTETAKLVNYASDTGTTNAYALAPAPALTAYTAGQIVTLKPANANSGTSTLNVSALGVKTIKMPDGSNLSSGVLKTSGVYLLVYNGTNFILLNPSLPAGVIIDRAYASYTTNTALSTLIPRDDTIPQNTEGTEIVSASLTPKASTNRIRVTFTGFGAVSTAASMIAALFVDTDASAVFATATFQAAADYHGPISFTFEHAPGDTAAHTYKVRIGPSTGTMRLNGNSSARFFGGVAACTLTLEEISA